MRMKSIIQHATNNRFNIRDIGISLQEHNLHSHDYNINDTNDTSIENNFAKASAESNQNERNKSPIFKPDKSLADYNTLIGIREFNNIFNGYYDEYNNECNALNFFNVEVPEISLNDSAFLTNDNNKYNSLSINKIGNENEKIVGQYDLDNSNQLHTINDFLNICNDTANIDVSEFTSYPSYEVTENKLTYNIEIPLIDLDELDTVDEMENKNENSIEKEFVDLDSLNIIHSQVNEANEFEPVHNAVDEYENESKAIFNLDFDESLLNLDFQYSIKEDTETAVEDLDNLNKTQIQNDKWKFEFKKDKDSIVSYNNANKNPCSESQCITSTNNPLQNVKRKLDRCAVTDENISIHYEKEIDNKIRNDKNNNNMDSENQDVIQHNDHNYAMITKIPKLEKKIIDLIILSSDDESQKDDKTDVISISSDEILMMPDKTDSDPDGYHSSDFEFIDENEAKKDNILLNLSSQEIIPDYFYTPPTRKDENNDNYKENHKIPHGDDFVNLFSDNDNHLPNYCLENKAISSGMAMNAGFERVGFDMRLFRENPRRKDCKELLRKAMDCEKQILSMYPGENRRKRHRRY